MNIAALGSFAGGIPTGLEGAFQRQLQQQQIQQEQQQALAQKLLGGALAQYYGAPMPQTQSGIPGLSGLSGLMSGIGSGISSLFGGAPQTSQGTGAPGTAPPGGPPASPPAPGGPAALSSAPPVPSADPSTPGPPTFTRQPTDKPVSQAPSPTDSGTQLSPGAAALVGKLDFPTLVKLIARQPGATPEAIGTAIMELQQYMNAQAMQDYRMAMMGIGQGRLANEQERTKIYGEDIKTKGDKLALEEKKFEASQQHFAERSTQMSRRLDQAAATTDTNARIRLLSLAESDYRGLLHARAEALLAANNNARDPHVTALDDQIKQAKEQLDAAKADAPHLEPKPPKTSDEPKPDKVVKSIPEDIKAQYAAALKAGRPVAKMKAKLLQDGYDPNEVNSLPDE